MHAFLLDICWIGMQIFQKENTEWDHLLTWENTEWDHLLTWENTEWDHLLTWENTEWDHLLTWENTEWDHLLTWENTEWDHLFHVDNLFIHACVQMCGHAVAGEISCVIWWQYCFINSKIYLFI